VLQIEDSISERVTTVLLPQLTGDECNQLLKRGTANCEAFESFLRGRYYWNTYTESGLARAIECYNHAIELDPHYALAYTGIADYYNWLGVFGFRPFKECSQAAKQAAEKAIDLDPAAAEAYSALGFATTTRHFDWAVAESHHRRAIEINPNYATGHHWYSFHLQMVGRFDEAVTEMLRARQLDPLAPGVMQGLGWCYYQARGLNSRWRPMRACLRRCPISRMGWPPMRGHSEALAELKTRSPHPKELWNTRAVDSFLWLGWALRMRLPAGQPTRGRRLRGSPKCQRTHTSRLIIAR